MKRFTSQDDQPFLVTAETPARTRELQPSRLAAVVAMGFILLQSACTAIMAVSGVRVVIGLGALAAASGLNRPAAGFHGDAIRIPMMVVAVGGSLVNLYIIWRIRSLRARPASSWRVQPPALETVNKERLQIAMAAITLLLVLAEWLMHRIVHNV